MNPYEIRLNLLKMAQEHLTNRYYNELEAKRNHQTGEYPKEIPAFPKFSDVVSAAEELNKFVGKDV